MQDPKYTLLIICEGENTEPLLFNSIRDRILNKTYNIGNVVVKIRPEPKLTEDQKEVPSKHKPTRKKIALRHAINNPEPIIIEGAPPLKWVLNGQEELRNGTYNEVWVVFDHDNHPTRKEAFDQASNDIKGKKINIAFSSRSFEYYILLNFEAIYYKFINTDCKNEEKKNIVCGSKLNSADCLGNLCVNGYARAKGYWNNSKSDVSIFPLIENKLNIGFENSIWLRIQSELMEHGVPIYDRNPYTNVDNLIKRLTNHSLVWITKNNPEYINNIQIEINNDNTILIKNVGKIAIVVQSNSFCKVSIKSNQRQHFGDRLILYPTNKFKLETEKKIDLSQFLEDQSYFLFSHEGKAVMFGL